MVVIFDITQYEEHLASVQNGEGKFELSDGVMEIDVPIQIGGTDTPWLAIVTIPQDAIAAEANATSMRMTLIGAVVVAIEGVKVGMIVDGVSEVLRVAEDTIEPPPMVTTVDSAFITAIAKLESKLVILLDLCKVLSLQEKANLAAMPG
jgi:hypothetical protein